MAIRFLRRVAVLLAVTLAGLAFAQAPGAPTIGVATAGNAEAYVAFIAPDSAGGSPISAYTATCTAASGNGNASGIAPTSPIAVSGLVNGIDYACVVTATNASGTSAPSAAAHVTPQADAPLTLIGVVSRKAHGAAGTFDMPLDTAIPIDGPVAVEPRVAGAGHRIVFQFNAMVSSAGPVNVVDEAFVPRAATVTTAGSEVSVQVANAGDNKRFRVALSTVNGSTVNATAALGLLLGDASGVRVRDGATVRSIKARSGQPASARNFRFDINASGKVSAADIVAAKARGAVALVAASNPAAVARVVINQTGLILTAAGASRPLSAQAFDAIGNLLNVPIAWSSSRPSVIAVNAGGQVLANTAGGTSQITASAGGVVSAPLLALVAQPVAGAILLTDSQIVGEPVETTPDAEPSFTNTYRVSLTGVATPAVGDILINTESKIVAGRVVQVDASGTPIIVTLALVPLRDMFPTLELEETLDLSNAPITIPPDLAADYDVARVGNTFTFTPKAVAQSGAASSTAKTSNASEVTTMKAGTSESIKALQGPVGTSALRPFTTCERTGTGVGGEGAPLPITLIAPPLFNVTINPTLDFKYTFFAPQGIERFVVKADPIIKVEGGINIAAAFEGKIECKVELFAFRIPVGGPVALILGGLVPVGVGVEVGGKLTVATMGIGTKAEVKGKVKAGIVCPDAGFTCEFDNALDNLSATVTPTIKTPSIGDVRLEPSITAFGYLEAAIGNPILKSIRFEFVKLKVGAALAGSFALKESQLADPAYKSDYKLSLKASAGAGAKLSGVMAMLGLMSVNGAELVIATDIAKSPAGLASGAVTADKGSFVTGDTVKFKVKLDPATVDFLPIIGPYNVNKIQLVRNVGGTISVVGTVNASPAQTSFDFTYVAPDSGNVAQFSAFVVTYLLPFDLLALEIGQAQASSVTSLAGNYNNTCAVVGGGVQCSGPNYQGQLGATTAEGVRLVPVQTIAEDSNATAVGVGYYHACAVVNGGVQCWGENTSGQLGNGTAAPTAGRVQTLASGSGVTAIAVGDNHACAVVDGGVKCWGSNFYGQLGNGQFNTVAPRYAANPVQAIAPGSNVTSISVTSDNSCAVVAGGVKCWGDNQYGQFGNGNTTSSAVPVQVIAAGSGATAVAVSFFFTCAIVDGGVRCWGHNIYGQFGTGSKTTVASGATLPVQTIPPGSNVSAVAVGANHSCVLVNGGVKCAGENYYGFLGNGSTSPSLSFVQTIAPGSNVTVLGSGHYHTCAAVNGGIKCWGANPNGQLGNGTMVDSLVPVDVLPVAP